jgi:hypothetical protein
MNADKKFKNRVGKISDKLIKSQGQTPILIDPGVMLEVEM